MQKEVVRALERERQLAPRGRLSEESAGLVGVLFHASLNGLFTHKKHAFEARLIGARAGVPDLAYPVPRGSFCGLYVELKTPRGRVSAAQQRFMEMAALAGHCVVVSRSVEGTVDLVCWYENLESRGCSVVGRLATRAEIETRWSPEVQVVWP